jgi:ADP-heptose:LPS heptosyltransferase
MPVTAPRILIIRRRYLGDIALLGPFFRNLRLHWPEAEIAILVEERFAEVPVLFPEVDRVIAQPPRGIVPVFRLWNAIRRGRFTHVFDLDGNDRTALLTRLSGAPFRANLRMRPRFRSFYTHSLPVLAEDYSTHHITETQFALLGAAGVPVVVRDVQVRPKESDLAFARRLAEPALASSRPRMLVHPGSRSPCRIWPMERFARVIDRAREELDATTCLVGGPDDRRLLDEIRRDLSAPPAALIDEALTVPRFAALASLFDLMLCHDSGPMHLAALAGTPVVALLGSQNPVTFAPLGAGHKVLQPPLPCTACVAPGKCVPADSYRNCCVRNIGVEAVWTAVRDTLARRLPRAAPDQATARKKTP